jgi:hypothetical protein
MAAMTTPRERTEEIERQVLSERAQLASATKGRERDEPHDDLRMVCHMESGPERPPRPSVEDAAVGRHQDKRLTGYVRETFANMCRGVFARGGEG